MSVKRTVVRTLSGTGASSRPARKRSTSVATSLTNHLRYPAGLIPAVLFCSPIDEWK